MPAVVYFQRQQWRSCLYSSSRSLGPAEESCCCWSLGCAVCKRLWHFSAAPPDYTALLSMGLVTHMPYGESAPSEPSLSTYSLLTRTQTHILPPPPPHTPAKAAGTPRPLLAHTLSHSTRVHQTTRTVRYKEQETSGISNLTHHLCNSVSSHGGKVPLWNEKSQNTALQWGEAHEYLQVWCQQRGILVTLRMN